MHGHAAVVALLLARISVEGGNAAKDMAVADCVSIAAKYGHGALLEQLLTQSSVVAEMGSKAIELAAKYDHIDVFAHATCARRSCAGNMQHCTAICSRLWAHSGSRGAARCRH